MAEGETPNRIAGMNSFSIIASCYRLHFVNSIADQREARKLPCRAGVIRLHHSGRWQDDPMGNEDELKHLEELSKLCPAGFMIGTGFRNSRPARTELTYPPEWLKAYSENHMIMCDPMVMWAVAHSGWIRWSEISARYDDPLGVMRLAAEYGLRFGIGYAIDRDGTKTIAGVARSDREFMDAEAEQIRELLTRMHLRETRPLALTAPQLEAITAFSLGGSYDQICAELGISRTALRLRLERVRAAFNVSNNQDAVRQARDAGILPPQPQLSSLTGAVFPPPPALQKRDKEKQ